MIESQILIAGLFIILIASVVQGITAFGFSLVSMPLLTILIPLQTVVPIMVAFSIFANIFMLIDLWSSVKPGKIWVLTLSSVLAAPFGTYLLLIIEQSTLKIIVGVIIVLFALALWKGLSVQIKNEKLALIPVGLSSGLLNGSLSLMGPPVVLFLTNQGEDKTIFRANITGYSLIINVMTFISFYVGGLVDHDVVTYTLWLSPALMIGTFLGVKIGRKVKQALFRKITLLLIIVSGLSAIITALS